MSMRQTVTRSLLLSAVAWSALGGAALAQTLAQTGPGRPAQVDDVIVTATP
jgi:hypothetical protein